MRRVAADAAKAQARRQVAAARAGGGTGAFAFVAFGGALRSRLPSAAKRGAACRWHGAGGRDESERPLVTAGRIGRLSQADISALTAVLVVIVALCVPVVVGNIALVLVYGQAGSRVFRRMQEEGGMLADDDAHWKLGVLYFNPDDASLFLPERFGFGWTMNFARPAAWAFVLGGAALTAGFVVSLTFLAR